MLQQNPFRELSSEESGDEVTPAPVSPLTAKVLEWIGLHLRPIRKESFRDQNVFAEVAGGLDITFVRTHGPAEKAGMHGTEIVIALQGYSLPATVLLRQWPLRREIA